MKMELLAPAGDMQRLQAAVRYGADAVYLGADSFGMRAAPKNFSGQELADAAELAHRNNVRVYLTVNTLPRPDEVGRLPDFLRGCAEAGVDAMIAADLGVIALIRKTLPDMEVHASTQLGVVNQLTARVLWEMGVRRAVLARELTLEEISAIRAGIPAEMELEAFVHGAVCMSVSGRCVISNYLIGRDANRGECAQPCRWNYALMEEKRPGLFLPVIEDEGGSTILSACDLCMIEHLRELAEAGVTSAKIEGRAKSAYYTAVVTNAYRAAINAAKRDEQPPAWSIRELETISHRDYSTGFYFGRQPQMQSRCEGGYLQDWEVSAVVESCSGGRLFLSERNRFSVGDALELLCPGQPPVPLTVKEIQDGEGTAISAANHPKMRISIPFDGEAVPGAMLRRKR